MAPEGSGRDVVKEYLRSGVHPHSDFSSIDLSENQIDTIVEHDIYLHYRENGFT